jgi:hypothetical protein
VVKDLVKIVLGSSEGRLLPVHAIMSCCHCGHCCRFLSKWRRSHYIVTPGYAAAETG